MNGNTGNSIELLRLIYKRKYFILIITGLATLISVVFTAPYFLPPRYSAEVILYPPSTNSNRMLIERDLRFGSDKEIDEHIQLLRSSIVRDSLIKKYHLYKHYRIDTLASDKRYLLYEKFVDRVKIERTRYNSIAVSVSDEDPVMAATIANDIVALGDRFKTTIVKEKLQEAFTALASTIFDLSRQIDMAASDINAIYNKQVVTGSSFYKRTGIDQVKEQLDLKELMQQARTSDQVRVLEQLYFYESKLQQLATIQVTYDQALIGLNNQIPSSFVISPGEVADKKSFPVRWMIMLITAITSLIGAISIVILTENFKSVLALIKKDK